MMNKHLLSFWQTSETTTDVVVYYVINYCCQAL